MENTENLTVEEFEEAIEKAETVEDVINLYKNQGIDVTEADLKAIAGPEDGDELSEEALEDVAGGMIIRRIRIYYTRRIVIRIRRVVYRLRF